MTQSEWNNYCIGELLWEYTQDIDNIESKAWLKTALISHIWKDINKQDIGANKSDVVEIVNNLFKGDK